METNILQVKWEYKKFRLDAQPDFIQVLNSYGEEGWELVHLIEDFSGIWGVFKRPKYSKTPDTVCVCPRYPRIEPLALVEI